MTTKKVHTLPNYRVIKASFVSPSNSRGARIVLTETKRYNDDKTQRKYFSYDYAIGDVAEQAYQILERNGMKPICRASDVDNYMFMCDSWAEEFKSVTELK